MDFSQIFKKLTAKHCAFIGIFFWATAFVITKVVLKEVDAMSLGVLRYFFCLYNCNFYFNKEKNFLFQV